MSPIDAGDGRPARRRGHVERRADRPRQRRPRTGDRTPSRTRQVDPPRTDVDRARHDAEPVPVPPPPAARRDSSSTTVFCG